MRNHRVRALVATGIATIAALIFTGTLIVPAVATPPAGVTTTILGVGRFEDIDTRMKNDEWKATIVTKGASDVHVLQNTIAPGGSFGWHSHPGPSLVVVQSGTATFYFGADPTCTPHVVQAGSGFVDQGGDIHIVRNEGSVDLVTVVTSLVPAGATRRIDVPDPGNCPF